jgi:hypothetical protein
MKYRLTPQTMHEPLSATVRTAKSVQFHLCPTMRKLMNSQKAFGTNYGLTAKIPKDAFKLTAGKPKEHVGDNGSGSLLHREFCDNCGSFILEYGVS